MITSRRKFLKRAAGLALAGALVPAVGDLIPARRIFLPPRGGWLPTFPRVALVGVGGDQSYGPGSWNWQRFPLGTPVVVDDEVVIAASWEDWSEGSRDRGQLTEVVRAYSSQRLHWYDEFG
jgi:hypothetical protein